MKVVYPVILFTEISGYSVYIPDFDANTQGESLTEAIKMAKDAIGIVGIVMEDDGKQIPEPSRLESVIIPKGAFLSLVEVDFSEYRRDICCP